MSIFTKKDSSGVYAKNRMNLLLASERLDCSPQTIAQMKQELIDVIGKYVVLDETAVTVQIQGEPPALRAELPLKIQKKP